MQKARNLVTTPEKEDFPSLDEGGGTQMIVRKKKSKKAGKYVKLMKFEQENHRAAEEAKAQAPPVKASAKFTAPAEDSEEKWQGKEPHFFKIKKQKVYSG